MYGIIKEMKERNKMKTKIEFKTGQLTSFRYRQPLDGTTERRIGVVCDIRNVKKHPVKNRNYRWLDSLNGTFKRSGKLFTIKHADSSVQTYYEGRCFSARKPNLFRRLCFYIKFLEINRKLNWSR